METRTPFEEEKAALLDKAIYALDQLHTNLNSLQRNLETINGIGFQFEGPTHLWTSFHDVLSNGTPQQPQEQYDVQQQVFSTINQQRKRQRDTTNENDIHTRSAIAPASRTH
ncbi:hypothetical protein BDF20DRAFT_910027 [Mycotypha africana]|uniref:uncharacterized protein n=1 Tax=Mycotypha africana TaxID=64632 RepID=UPI002300B181|nr:uncharacterized protein BDF20DRAFT_910027 [Mycotypha africana]KAI8987400.1 hypothetical protein BDF20DRAFT_910027 [Mycotypha africana]